jgi:hypothetical protein
MKFHYRMFSRKVILGTAAVLAVSGATGAAAVLAPSDLGLSRFIPAVTAQVVTPAGNNDITSQLPFDRVAQAPITTPSTTLTDAPTASLPSPSTSAPAPVAQAPASRSPAVQDPAARAPVTQAPANQTAQAPVAQAPISQAPVGQGPIAQTPIAAPQGRQITTSSPGVVVRPAQHVQVRPAYRPRVVYRYDEYCAD